MHANFCLHNIPEFKAKPGDRVTASEPFALVSVRVAAGFMPAALAMVATDPYALVADGIAGLDYHPALSRPDAICKVGAESGTVFGFTVATRSGTPPLLRIVADPVPVLTIKATVGIEETDNPTLGVWRQLVQFSDNNYGSYYHNSVAKPQPIQVGWTVAQLQAIGWHSSTQNLPTVSKVVSVDSNVASAGERWAQYAKVSQPDGQPVSRLYWNNGPAPASIAVGMTEATLAANGWYLD